MVLERSEDGGAQIVLLVHDPNDRRDSHDSDYAQNDKGGQQRTGLCKKDEKQWKEGQYYKHTVTEERVQKRRRIAQNLLCLLSSAASENQTELGEGQTIPSVLWGHTIIHIVEQSV